MELGIVYRKLEQRGVLIRPFSWSATVLRIQLISHKTKFPCCWVTWLERLCYPFERISFKNRSFRVNCWFMARGTLLLVEAHFFGGRRPGLPSCLFPTRSSFLAFD